jgi:hypothetical protein
MQAPPEIAKPGFSGAESPVKEVHWRGLCLRPEVEPPTDLMPPASRLRATLRSGRWEVTPNGEGKWRAAWRCKGVHVMSIRSSPEAALDALAAYLSKQSHESAAKVAIAADLARLE